MSSAAEFFSEQLQEKLTEIQGNRMDVLQGEAPRSIFEARQIRKRLRNAVNIRMPETPASADSEISFFDKVERAVFAVWSAEIEDGESAQDFFAQKCGEWRTQLAAHDDEEDRELVEILSNPDELKEKLFAKRISQLESLREKLPEAWNALVMFSSEIQLAEVTLSRIWLKKMPDTAFEGSGFSKVELLLENELATLLGKLVDHGYLKQNELDIVLSNDESEHEGEDIPHGEAGRKYLYRLPSETGEVAKSLVDVLPVEIKRFSTSLERLADEVGTMLQGNFLDQRYAKFPSYLRHMSEMYASSETDKDKIYEGWKALYAANAELLKDGCPLVINPQEDDPFSVVGFELRLGLRSRELQQLEQQGTAYADRAYTILNEAAGNNPGLVREEPKRADVFLSNQTFAFGGNLSGVTLAESYHGQMFLHVNEVQRMAKETEIPALERTLGIEIDREAYYKQAILETMRHEIAHGIFASEDAAVIDRMGESGEMNILEELKAETAGMGLLQEDLDTMTEEEAQMICLAKLGTEMQYVINKSSEEDSDGEDYYLCAVKILTELMKSGLLNMEGDRLKVENPKDAIRRIADIGDEVLELYKKQETTPHDVASYSQSLREMKSDADFVQLERLIKSGN